MRVDTETQAVIKKILTENPGISEKRIVFLSKMNQIKIHDCLYKSKGSEFDCDKGMHWYTIDDYYRLFPNKDPNKKVVVKKNPVPKIINYDYEIKKLLHQHPEGLKEWEIVKQIPEGNRIKIHDCLYKNLNTKFFINDNTQCWTLIQQRKYPRKPHLFYFDDFYNPLYYYDIIDIEHFGDDSYFEEMYKILEDSLYENRKKNRYIHVNDFILKVKGSGLPKKPYYWRLANLAVSVNRAIYDSKQSNDIFE